jgi:hypothetical protein
MTSTSDAAELTRLANLIYEQEVKQSEKKKEKKRKKERAEV